MELHTLGATKPARGRPRPSVEAFLSVGFRPFFLVASGFAVVAVAAWDLMLRGVVVVPSRLGPIGWHAHEMLFGFTGAVLAGFLLTAVQNWTGRRTANGGRLFALFVLWVLGRVAMAVSALAPPGVAELIDVLFLPAVAAVIARPIFASKNARNYGVPVLLLLLGGANLALHLSVLGVAPSLYRPALMAALFLPLVFLVLIGGRVIPGFTENALRSTGIAVRERNIVDALAMASVVVALVARVLAESWPSLLPAAAVASAVTGAMILLRMRGWRSFATRAEPILWVLHLGYAVLGVGFFALAFADVQPLVLSPSAALHVLTIGGLGVLILGMTSRVALGHTGRPLVVKRSIAVAYGLLALAVVPRVVVPALAPSWAGAAFDVTALLFGAAFGLYFVVYLPILVTLRPDGALPTR